MIELVTAIIFELIRSEPPEMVHPTVWFGKIIKVLDRFMPGTVVFGVIPPLATTIFAFILAEIPSMIPKPLSYILAGYLLYTSISIRSMLEHAERCVEGGRINLMEVKKIVSRDLNDAEEWMMNSAVIESMAENFIDGVLAPLLYYSVFGIHGALIYRAINTCDAMLGYRKGRYERFGKISARLDDLANLIPSRVSLILYLILSKRAFFCGMRKNPKFNGHSVSAMAGLLGVRLEKTGYYTIDCGKDPETGDVKKAMKSFTALSGMAVLSALLLRLLV